MSFFPPKTYYRSNRQCTVIENVYENDIFIRENNMFFYRWKRALCHGIYAVAMVIVTPAAKKIYIKVKWYWRLHGRLQSEIRNFPSRVEKYFTRFQQWPRLSKRKFRITARPSWNILYIWTMSLNVICSLHLLLFLYFFSFSIYYFFQGIFIFF